MHLPSPHQLKVSYPLSKPACAFIEESRQAISRILKKKDPRLLCIVGPCSIHNVEEGLLFAEKLKILSEKTHRSCFICMRAYIEKPRTQSGWKGLVHDPHLNGSDDLADGLAIARSFLVRLAEIGIPAATEFLTPHLVPYIEDTITWGCIGARTSSSQVHRTLASALSIPIGFKNSVDGNIDCAISGAAVAMSRHTFMHFDEDGKLCRFKSRGNPQTHVVLRGSLTGPNYDEKTVLETLEKLKKDQLPERVLIDCSHGNSSGLYYKQQDVFESVMMQVQEGNKHIIGLMLESYLKEGRQTIPPKNFGVSITDSCIDFSTASEMISSCLLSDRSMSLTQS